MENIIQLNNCTTHRISQLMLTFIHILNHCLELSNMGVKIIILRSRVTILNFHFIFLIKSKTTYLSVFPTVSSTVWIDRRLKSFKDLIHKRNNAVFSSIISRKNNKYLLHLLNHLSRSYFTKNIPVDINLYFRFPAQNYNSIIN